VGDEHSEATVAQLIGGGVELFVDRLEGGFHQQPACARRPLGYRLQLVLGQPADHVVAQLGPAAQLDRHALGAERGPKLFDALAEPEHVGHEVGAHVGRGHHRLGALRGGAPDELDAVTEGDRPVVDAGQGVEVQLDALGSPDHRVLRFVLEAGLFVTLQLLACGVGVNG